MNRDDIQKLLGGYATGTLTPEEQQALFEAALTDQELFDALGREEALREVLTDQTARAHLLAAIDDAPAPWYRQWWRPMAVVAAAVLAVAGIAVWERSAEPKPSIVAKVELPRFQPPAAAPNPAPALPPPPEVRRAASSIKPLRLPEPKPVSPPRPMFAVPAAAPPLPSAQSPMAQSQQSQTLGQLKTADSLLPASPQPVRGTVTDASGAAVPSAQVLVKSLATGQTVQTSTDDRGQFTAAELPGGPYLVTASAPGFQTATLRDEAPATPVNLTLQVGASTEAVAVAGAAAPARMEARPAAPRAGFGGFAGAVAGMKKAKSSSEPAIACQLLRQIPGGGLVPVPASGNVPAGSLLTLRVTPAADGYLRIVNGTATVANPKVRRGVNSETTLPAFEQTGRVELQIYFSRQAGEAKDQASHVTVTFNVQ